MAAHTRGRRDDEGQSLVELGVLIPLLLIIVLGAIDFGRAYYAYISVTNAARAGAQYASASNANAANNPGITAARGAGDRLVCGQPHRDREHNYR
jgi:Flp pilus assembly protein TadG